MDSEPFVTQVPSLKKCNLTLQTYSHMPTPKRIQPDEPIGLKLGVSERLMIQQLPLVEQEIAQRVAKTPKKEKKIGFTLDELDDLIGHVAAELNHTDDKSKAYYLEQIYEKIVHLLHTYTDQPEPETEPEFNPQTVELNGWVHFMLETANKAGIPTNKYNCKVILSKAQRRTIVELDVSDKIKELLTVDATGSRTFDFTADELASICHALAEPLSEAQGKYLNQLLKAAEKIAQGLTEGLTNKKKPRRKSSKPKTAFQIKITLKEIKPVVWRRFQVLDCVLTDLHVAIQVVMGWQNCHLYSFKTGDDTYCDPSLCEDMEYDDGRRIKLSHLVKQGFENLEYVYDFGDHWQHSIEIESAFQPENGVTFLVCLEGEGISPPEDVGGSIGYEEFLRVINDPEDEEHQRYLDWCGGWFDPEAFDLEFVNRVLGKIDGLGNTIT